MPSVSPKQKKFMAAAAASPKFAKAAGIKQTVAKEFNMADAKRSRPRGKYHNAAKSGYHVLDDE